MNRADVLTIYRDSSSWRVVAHDETAYRWIKSFDTADMPLPYPATMSRADVQDKVQLLNPDYRIECREADQQPRPVEEIECLFRI